jgi:hypothetical protein
MCTQAEIKDQQQLLAELRSRCDYRRWQLAIYGPNAEYAIHRDLREACDGIRRIKKQLRSCGVTVDDLPNDEDDLDVDVRSDGDWLSRYLPQIDFKEPIKELQADLDRFAPEGGAAVFVVEQGYELCGDLFAQRVQSLLQHSEPTLDFRAYSIGIGAHQKLDSGTFLQKLNQYIGAEASANGAMPTTEELIIALCDSLQNGSIRYLNLHIRTEVEQGNTFVSWFIEHFWTPLAVRVVAKAKQEPIIKFITLISVDFSLPLESFGRLNNMVQQFNTAQQLDSQKNIALSLARWTEADIREWLCRFARILSPKTNLGKAEIASLAEDIFRRSHQGVPPMIHMAILNHITQQYS